MKIPFYFLVSLLVFVCSHFAIAGSAIQKTCRGAVLGGLVLGEARLGEAGAEPWMPRAQAFYHTLESEFPEPLRQLFRDGDRVDWAAFDALAKFGDHLLDEKFKEEWENIGFDPSRSEDWETVWQESLLESPSRKSLGEDFKGLVERVSNQGIPGHMELIESFYSKLQSLPYRFGSLYFQSLGIESKKWETVKDQAKKDAEALVSDLRSEFQNSLYKTSGFNDPQQLDLAIQSSENEKRTQWLQEIKEGRFDVGVFRPRSGRFWIPKTGFHNQFVTGSSRGTLAPDLRNKVESLRLGLEESVYSDYSAYLKPKYGMLLPDLEQTPKTHRSRGYGEDLYVLRKEKILARLTWTLGDSLASINGVADKVRFTPNRDWSSYFVPFEFLNLAVPFFYTSETNWFHPTRSDMDLNFKYFTSAYFEAQVFGPLDLSDVEAFYFGDEHKREAPPEAEFLDELQRHNIKIFRWNPDRRQYESFDRS